MTMMGKRSLWVVEHASRRLSDACGPMMSRFKYATLRCPTKKYSIRTLEREHSTKTDAAMVPRKASFFEGELRFPRALYAMPAANEYARQVGSCGPEFEYEVRLLRDSALRFVSAELSRVAVRLLACSDG